MDYEKNIRRFLKLGDSYDLFWGHTFIRPETAVNKMQPIFALVIWISVSCPAFAQVKPGDFITPENALKVIDLVSPGVFSKVRYGMTMKIVPTELVHRPPPYHNKTE